MFTMEDQVEGEKTPAQKAQEAGLTFEETPVIGESPKLVEPPHLLDVPQQTVKKPRRLRWVGNLIFVILLFGLGIWLSSQLRFFVTEDVVTENGEESLIITPTTTLSVTPKIALGDENKTQTVNVSAIGSVLRSVTYQLPQSVLRPTCDGSGCASSGTNLSGGTRFTVAARGKGERLPDFRGAILTDVNGKEFTMRQTMVGGKNVYEYIGDFTGRTGGGYQFTKMRGVLVPITDSLSVEFNHFAPFGVVTDFVADDVLFEKIIASVNIPAIVALTPTLKPTTTATSSGN